MKNQWRFRSILIVALIVLPSCIHGKIKSGDYSSCGALQETPWKYCVTQGSDPERVLVYLHGAGGSEHSWADTDSYTHLVSAYWEKRGIKSPSVIAISSGEYWILGSKKRKDFFDKVVLELERRFDLMPRERFLLGESMGGFNAAQLLFHDPSKFTKVALACPAIYEDPRQIAKKAQAILKANLGAKELDELNPILQAKHILNASSPKLYISCGQQDELGFYSGASEFAATAKNAGAQVQWVPLAGGHCAVDSDSLAAFLSPSG